MATKSIRFYNKQQYNIDFPQGISIDEGEVTLGEFFAGGGGWTSGAERVEGIHTRWILNHDAIAIKTNAHHHKRTKVYWADFFAQDEHQLEHVDILHASIECQPHSNAAGGKIRSITSYMMADELLRYILHLMPLVLTIENVPEFKKWGPLDDNGKRIPEKIGEYFEAWKRKIMSLGYRYTEDIRNAADDGVAQRRVRYFGIFYKPGMNISFPETTHSKHGEDGKLKWVACKDFINLDNEGISIFGREFNEDLPANLRRPLVSNSLKRIAGGIRRLYPEINEFLVQYYGGDNFERFQSISDPLYTVRCDNCHQLVQTEKLKFIMDYCRGDIYSKLEDPLNAQLTWQTKQLTSLEGFITQYYGNGIQVQRLDEPITSTTTKDRHQIVRLEKLQFIAQYFNSNGKPDSNVWSIDGPLPPVLTENKSQLVTILDQFDIKVRFLDAEELAGCSSFAPGYFTDPTLKLSHKNAVRMIGNCVPPKWPERILGHNIGSIQEFKQSILN
ncbi:DNA cytosine methyltransferase [uncultured Sphingobacterium sp.]|uniref:DNA cytosine methyltransferase n=1 Tax=uncultured Sphingobacterium sp. TaxID=182688 RepID=UPI0025E28A77|nr:DNA cytosine methyltransferase [uncultured Sphingobacterium sp.]